MPSTESRNDSCKTSDHTTVASRILNKVDLLLRVHHEFVGNLLRL